MLVIVSGSEFCDASYCLVASSVMLVIVSGSEFCDAGYCVW